MAIVGLWIHETYSILGPLPPPPQTRSPSTGFFLRPVTKLWYIARQTGTQFAFATRYYIHFADFAAERSPSIAAYAAKLRVFLPHPLCLPGNGNASDSEGWLERGDLSRMYTRACILLRKEISIYKSLETLARREQISIIQNGTSSRFRTDIVWTVCGVTLIGNRTRRWFRHRIWKVMSEI